MPTREDFEMALALARKTYAARDPKRQAEKAGVSWSGTPGKAVPEGHAEVPFLGTTYRVEDSDGEVRYAGQEGKEPALWEKILILHYLNTSDGTPLARKHISFKEIQDGRFYLPTFEKRAVIPLLGRFGRNPEEIWDPGRSLGAWREDLGDFSVTVPVFPRVPVTLVFWKQDEEFEARLTILFDSTVVRYLPTEDIVLSSQMMAYRLIALSRREPS